VSRRSRSREAALKVLYQLEHFPGSVDEALEVFKENFGVTPQVMDYAEQLVRGVEANRSRIDAMISLASRSWRPQRMSQVDRNILRLACYEMLLSPEPVPHKVAINEAVELAKRYSGPDAPGFVNAVLDTLWRQQVEAKTKG